MSLRLSSRELKLIRSASAAVLSPGRFASEKRWHTVVMETFARLTGAYKVGLRLPAHGDYRWERVGFEDSAIAEYREYYHRFDFGRALGGQEAKGSFVLSSLQYFAGRMKELRRSEYFCDYLRRYKVFDTIALSTRRSQHQKGAVIYLWHEKELTSPQRARATAIMNLLAPAFRSGMASGSGSSAVSPSVVTTIDLMSDACALFSTAGVLLHRNHSMCAMLAECGDPDELKGLIAEIARAVKGLFFEKKQEHSVAPPYHVTGRVAGVDYRIAGVALRESSTRNHAAILVTVVQSRGAQPQAPGPEALQARFGLTGREVEVALMLKARRTNSEVAARLGVSIHTARHHTENVLRKLGVDHRRSVALRLDDAIEK